MPDRPFAARSGLLLVTAGVLTVAGLARLPLPTLPWADDRLSAKAAIEEATVGDPGAWSGLRSLEPAGGPEPAHPSAPIAPTGAPVPQRAAQDVAPGDPPAVATLQELADELSRHRTAIAERERRLDLREAVLASVESRIGEQLTRLEALKSELERLTGQVTAEERAKIAQMVKVYEAMKAKNAAAIFEPMALDLLLPIVRNMRETKVAAIVAEMDPAKARALTAELVGGTAVPPPP